MALERIAQRFHFGKTEFAQSKMLLIGFLYELHAMVFYELYRLATECRVMPGPVSYGRRLVAEKSVPAMQNTGCALMQENLQPIEKIAALIGIAPDALTLYGRHKAKVPYSLYDAARAAQSGRNLPASQ